MKKTTRLILAFFTSLIVVILAGYIYFASSMSPVNKNSTEAIEFIVKPGTPLVILFKNLKEAKLIKNDLTLKVYSKLHPGVAKAGRYILYKNMSATEIYDAIINGKVTKDTVWLTFVEGKRLTYIASVIAKKFDYSEEDIIKKMDDRDFINKMIDKYPVLTEKVLQNGIYHPLEGYLFPDTYEFESDATLEEIIETMISTLDKKVSKYKSEINANGYDIHDILTLASIIELESAGSTDRKGVSGVFYNRLKKGLSLGSDVTTYYAVGKDFSKDLTVNELNSCNGYNTRGQCVKGLPIGPIASSSIESIEAAIEPTNHEYLYFVADKYGKTYFSKDYNEHAKIVSDLKSKGLWHVYK